MKITWDGGGDHGFRSLLERKVADELDRLAVVWQYEPRIVLPGARQVAYLPDFLIDGDMSHLDLPRYVECKPQQMLYTLRDVVGVTRRAGEYFKDDVHLDGLTAADLHDNDLVELAKPKRLAELSGEQVLIVGAVQGTNSLSVLLTATGAVFSRSNVFVNQRGHQRAVERAAREAQWAAESDRRAVLARLEQQRQAEENRQRVQAHLRHIVTLPSIQPRFASACYGCQRHGSDGLVYRVHFTDGTDRWERVCPACIGAVG